MKHAAFACAAALFLSACGDAENTALPTDGEEQIIAGGECSYVENVFEADVVGVEDDRVELKGPDGVSFYMQADDFDATPAAGETYTIKGEMIIEGTCTPEIYTVMEGAG